MSTTSYHIGDDATMTTVGISSIFFLSSILLIHFFICSFLLILLQPVILHQKEILSYQFCLSLISSKSVSYFYDSYDYCSHVYLFTIYEIRLKDHDFRFLSKKKVLKSKFLSISYKDLTKYSIPSTFCFLF